MDDDQIRNRIESLEARSEAPCRGGRGRRDRADDIIKRDAERLAAIKVELDQLWDLLRQREANAAPARIPTPRSCAPTGTVEDYLG